MGTIDTSLQRIYKQLQAGNVGLAIMEMDTYLMAWPNQQSREKLETLKSEYDLMTDYWTQGAADPERDEQYNKLLQRVYVLMANIAIHRHLSATSFLQQLHRNARQTGRPMNLEEIRQEMENFVSEAALLELEPEHTRKEKSQALYKAHQQQMNQLFNYLLTSNLTSWERNDNYYFTAPSPAGPWTRQGNFCPEGSLTWNSQTTFVMKLPDGTPMYMGDRWSYPHQASAATYVWLPLQTNGVRLSIPAYWNAWDVRTIAPVDPLKECLKTQVNFSSNDIGAKTTIPFKGRRIFVTGEANAHGGYAKLTIRNQKGKVCVTTLIDFYAKMPEQGIRYASPILPMDEYELVIEVTGDRSNWTDKRHNLYGTDGCFVNVLAVYNE